MSKKSGIKVGIPGEGVTYSWGSEAESEAKIADWPLQIGSCTLPGTTAPSSITWTSTVDASTYAHIAALEAHIASLEKVLDGQTATIVRLCEFIDKMWEGKAR